MNWILYVLVLIIGTAYFVNRLIYHIHMYQLNSYRLERYARFIKNNANKIFSVAFIIFAIILLLSSALYTLIIDFQHVLLLILWLLVALLKVMNLYRKKEKTKKPLVYTMRVKRILGLTAGLYILFVLVLIRSPLFIFGITIVMLLAPIVMILSNLLLKPFELYLKRYYYDDAKKILRDHKDLIKIGITGSYGKTSSKFILETILSQDFTTLVTPHSYNTTLGVVITVRKSLNRSTEVFVAEMGAKQKGDIKEICDLVEPDYGMVTAVGPQHLETFGSLNNVINTKFEMMEAVKGKDKKGFVNGDSHNVREGMNRFQGVNYIAYGQGKDNQVRIEDVSTSVRGSSFTIASTYGRHSFETKLLGMHNILNIAGAIGIAYELGMTYEKIAIGVKEIKAIPHRLELKSQGDYMILDDAFNSNPTGAKFALDVLSQFDTGQKIIMTPGMIELGNMDKEIHQEFGKQISQVCDEVLLIGENKTIDIKKGLQDSGFDMSKVYVFRSVYEGFAHIHKSIRKGDILLIENDLPDNFNE